MADVPLGPIWITFSHPAYNCSRVMDPGLSWNKVHDGSQSVFGLWSLVFGITAEIIYLPCMLALRRERNSCFRIMFALAIMDMTCLPVSALIFGVGLIMGEVYCSHPTFHYYLGAFGLGSWCCASMTVLILSVNRVTALLGKSKLFRGHLTTAFLTIAVIYGLAVGLFTPPPMLNSQFQSYFFNPFISFTDEYIFVNWLHAINNIAVVFFSCLMYAVLCLILVSKQGALKTDQGRKRLKATYPVFLQAALICLFNLVSSSIYVYMNFFYTPLWLIQVAQIMWQFAQGMPPVIYILFNKTIRGYAQRMLTSGQPTVPYGKESWAVKSKMSQRSMS